MELYQLLAEQVDQEQSERSLPALPGSSDRTTLCVFQA